jgi:hypothetical protein
MIVVVMVTIVPVVSVSDIDHNLRVRRDGQGRCEQQQKAKGQQNPFHIGFHSSSLLDACRLRRVA